VAFGEAGKGNTRDGVAHSKAILFIAANWGSDPEHPESELETEGKCLPRSRNQPRSPRGSAVQNRTPGRLENHRPLMLEKTVPRLWKKTPLMLLFLGLVPSVATSQALTPLWPNAEEIEEFLKNADIVDRTPLGSGITKPEKVTLERNGETGYAVFKKVDKDHDNWRCEVAAYELDKLLGLGMVPPTVERRVGGRKGCLQYWVTGTTMESYPETPVDLETWRQQVSVMWLFDDLIANIDRHLNNAMVSPANRLVLIDNSKTFRGYRTLLNDLDANGTGTHARFWCVPYDPARVRYPTRYPRQFVERLRAVSEDEIKDAIGRYIWGYDQKLVLKRWELILARLEEMEGSVTPPSP